MMIQWEIEQVASGSKSIIQAETLTEIFLHLMASGYSPVHARGPLQGAWRKRVDDRLHCIARPAEIQTITGVDGHE